MMNYEYIYTTITSSCLTMPGAGIFVVVLLLLYHPLIERRIAVLLLLLLLCHAQSTPPGCSNGVDWRLMVKD